eukprot:5061842-Amphidinium_carterae.1
MLRCRVGVHEDGLCWQHAAPLWSAVWLCAKCIMIEIVWVTGKHHECRVVFTSGPVPMCLCVPVIPTCVANSARKACHVRMSHRDVALSLSREVLIVLQQGSRAWQSHSAEASSVYTSQSTGVGSRQLIAWHVQFKIGTCEANTHANR